MKKLSKNRSKQALTVVVSTYNRARLLKNCLQSLIKQTANGNYEVFVVDNNSKDNSREVANDFVKRYKNFRYFNEKRQGLSWAKNRGWKEAGGQYVAFIDDDAMAERDWVAQILKFTKRHPDVSVFGGPYYGYTEEKKPDWFPPEVGTFTLGNKERKINTPKESLSGSNTIFKRSVFAKQGGFNTSLGMKGNKLSYGEESNLIFELAKEGCGIYYSPSIKVRHLIAKRKLSLRWLLRNKFIRGKLWSSIHGRYFTFYQLLKKLWKSLGGLGLLFNTKGGPFKRRVYYSLGPICSRFGAIAYFLRTKFF